MSDVNDSADVPAGVDAPTEPLPTAPEGTGPPFGEGLPSAEGLPTVPPSDAPASDGPSGDGSGSAGVDLRDAVVTPDTPTGPRIIAVANQKGGVGKTTTTVNLGAALAELGERVLLVDLDPQANATTGLGIEHQALDVTMYDVLVNDAPIDDCIEPTEVKGLFVAPAHLDLAGVDMELASALSRESKLRRRIQDVRDQYDYILLDCPPSLGLLSVNGLVAATEVLVPVQCEYYALHGIAQLTKNVDIIGDDLNPGLRITTVVMVMYDGRTKSADNIVAEVREYFGDAVCRNVIPRNVRLAEAPAEGQPITVYAPSSRGAVAYRELAREVSR